MADILITKTGLTGITDTECKSIKDFVDDQCENDLDKLKYLLGLLSTKLYAEGKLTPDDLENFANYKNPSYYVTIKDAGP